MERDNQLTRITVQFSAERLEQERQDPLWSYASVTESAERMIRFLVGQDGSVRDTAINRERAFGVYLAWDALTIGVQRPADQERLARLTR